MKHILQYTKSCDAYSYGVILFEIVTQQPVSRFGSCEALLEEVATKNGAPAMMLKLVYQCTSSYPKSRPSFDRIYQQVTTYRLAINRSKAFANLEPVKSGVESVLSYFSKWNTSKSSKMATWTKSDGAASSNYEETNRFRYKKFVYGVIVVLIIAGICGGLAGYFSSKSKQTSSTTSASFESGGNTSSSTTSSSSATATTVTSETPPWCLQEHPLICPVL